MWTLNKMKVLCSLCDSEFDIDMTEEEIDTLCGGVVYCPDCQEEIRNDGFYNGWTNED